MTHTSELLITVVLYEFVRTNPNSYVRRGLVSYGRLYHVRIRVVDSERTQGMHRYEVLRTRHDSGGRSGGSLNIISIS